jgi:hypothetical protein
VERDAAAGVKHCVALLDLISEMNEVDGEEQQAIAGKAVCVLALAALDGIAYSPHCCVWLATCHAASGATVCGALAAKGSIKAVVEAGTCASGSSSFIMQLACSAFFSSMSNTSKVRKLRP